MEGCCKLQDFMMTNNEIANRCLKMLDEETEWISRYAGYADVLTKNEVSYKHNRHHFRINKPLTLYTTVSKAKEGCEYDIRYKGQSIGHIRAHKGKILLSTEPKKRGNNGDYYFDFREKFVSIDWHSDEAKIFRKHFLSLSGKEAIKSPEHCIENNMLLELSKTTRSQDKLLCNIQPVRLLGCFFQMPTPLSASNHKEGPKYSRSGGGIDILARVRHTASDIRLCVCELKDENKSSEPEEVVVQQAISYATFIGKLLKTEGANHTKWWKLFGFNREIPYHIDIDVVAVMPIRPTGNNAPVCEDVVCLQNINVTLHIHSIYFEADSKTGKIQSIFGTLKDIIDSSCK